MTSTTIILPEIARRAATMTLDEAMSRVARKSPFEYRDLERIEHAFAVLDELKGRHVSDYPILRKWMTVVYHKTL